MKRLFGRKEKDKPQRSVEPEQPKSTSSLPTRAEAAPESVHANDSASNGLLSIDAPPVTRRKSSFFSTVTRGSSKTTMSTSGSETGSSPATAGSISGSSDASSSAVSTRNDEPAGSRAVETAPVPTPAVEEKAWPSWMSKSIGKGRAKKQQLQQQLKSTASSFSNLSRSSTSGLGAAFHAIQKGGDNSTNSRRPSNLESSEASEASEDSSWDELEDDNDELDRNSNSAEKVKNFRVPTSGRQHRVAPHHQTGQPHSRSVFGGNAVGASLTRETSKALANLHALTIDALVPPTTSPPLVQSSSSIPFPKSSNRIRVHDPVSCTSFAQHSTLHTEILRKRLLRRVERRVLTASEQASIQPLAARTPRTKDADKRKLPATEETYEDSKAVGGGWSKGMKRWAMRPCFEERVVVWKAASAGIIVSPVQRDSRMGVAALEFSEGAEALAGLHRQNELPPPPSDIYVPASNRNKLPPPLVIPRSPHGMNHLDPRSLGLDKHVRGRIKLSSKLRPATVDTTAMDEDDLPLGVVMAHRRNKEETEERKRRAAAERAERERKAREEEERKRKYAEEVAAARARRDAEKSGKSGSKKDAWLAGEADALPPPIKPFATHYLKSSSNPNLASSTSTPLLSVPPKPSAPRRQTTGASSSASSFVASTTGTVTPRTQEASWQHSAPATPMPWTGLPLAGTPPGSQYDMSAFSGTLPNMPMSAPISQLHYPPTMMMLPPHPDPVSMAMFEQGLRPWAMDANGGSSSGTLTPPRPLFGFASSGDSSGSLTPPRFPNSRPSSWGSSSEDVRNALRQSGTVGSRPGLSNTESQEWRRSRSSMHFSQEDLKGRNSHSKSPVDPPSSPWSEHTLKPPSSSSLFSPLRPGHHQQQRSVSSNISSKTRPGGASSIRSRTSVVPPVPSSTHPNPYGLSTNSTPLNHSGVIPRKSPTQTTLKEASTTQRKSRLFS